jgi:quinone-modifying oxidoreductase, subunit QmoA
LNPRYVNEKCTCCGKCAEACTMEIDNAFNYGMDKSKAAYLPHDMAFPPRYVLDPGLVKSAEAQKVKEACPYDAIDLNMEAKTLNLKVGSVVWATGWKPYDAHKLETYGFGQFPDVITNVMMERMAAWGGPTQGKIVRPSDGQPPKTVAFVQCAGSRDQNHLPFCSGICCLASMKEATYVRDQYPDAKIYIFFIDIRATDRLEDFYVKVKKDENLHFFKGKVAKITQDASGKGLVLRVEDTTSEALQEITVDLVVLATGMQPNTSDAPFRFRSLMTTTVSLPARTRNPASTPQGQPEPRRAWRKRFRTALQQRLKPYNPSRGGNGPWKKRKQYMFAPGVASETPSI